MTALYTLTITTDFSASHIIPGHPGKCSRLHGHNWRVEISVQAQVLDRLGMAIDFQDIKRIAKNKIETLDHYHLNDLPAFQAVSPTAENVAAWLYQEMADALQHTAVSVSAVKLWETDRSCVEYSERIAS